MSDLLGSSILGYDVTEILGSGAYGKVYKVEKYNQTGHFTRALKHIELPTKKQYYAVLNSMGGNVEKTDEYFEKVLDEITSEVTILNGFTERDLPNVVHYYDSDVEVIDNPLHYNVFILMEYLTPLNERLTRRQLKVDEVIFLGLDILKGLENCHKHNVIHRDIKLDNIFYSDKVRGYKIGDFGVSIVLDDKTRAESIKGTLDYIAPEVYIGQEGYTQSVDLYSLGIVLYRLLNYNRNPFLPRFPESYYPQDEDEAFNRRMKSEKAPLPALGGEKIGKVIQKAISSKEERYKSAEEFYNALYKAAEETSPEILDQVINSESSLYYEDSYEDWDNTDGWDDYNHEQEYVEEYNNNYEDYNYNPPPVIESPPVPVPVAPIPPPAKQKSFFSDLNGKKILLISLIIILAVSLVTLFLIRSYIVNRQNSYVSAPTFSVNGGYYEYPQNVQILDSEPGVTIYYTTDGSTPDEYGILYTPGNNIHISSTTTLKSVAINSSGVYSDVTSATYTINSYFYYD